MAFSPSFPARWPQLALAMLLALPTPATAQWIAVGRWGSDQSFRFVAPGTWMVLSTNAGVEASVEGDNHVTRLTLACQPGDSAARVVVSRYFGYDLPREDGARANFLLALDDHRIDLTVVWSDAADGWVAEGALDTDTLSRFSWANRLRLLDAGETELATYRMNGTSAAREALRRRCGI